MLACCLNVVAQRTDYYFKPLHHEFDSIAALAAAYVFDNSQTELPAVYLDRMDSIAEATGPGQLRVRASLWRIECQCDDLVPDSVLTLLTALTADCDSTAFAYDYAYLKYQTARAHVRSGDFLSGYRELQQALSWLGSVPDHFLRGNINMLLALLFHDIRDDEQARRYLSEARRLFTLAGYSLSRTYFFEAAMTQDADEAMTLFRQALRHGGKDWAMTFQVLTYMSTAFLNAQQPDSAETYAQKALRLQAEKLPDYDLLHYMGTITHVQVMLERGLYDEAISQLDALQPLPVEARTDQWARDYYYCYAYAYEHLGEAGEALRYTHLWQASVDRLQADIVRQNVSRQQALDQIRLLEKDAKLSRQATFIVVMLFIIVVLVGGGLAVYFRQRYRIRKIENRELRNNLRQQALINQMNRQNFERDMQQKECEISSSTLLLAGKNDVLQQISQLTKHFYDHDQVPREFVRQVNHIVGESLATDDHWARFKLQFDAVHPGFFVKLGQKFPRLTENDLRLCAYIRIGMTSKEIAEVMLITHDSVNTTRYRLRRKLGLGKEASLEDFIRRV
ncbi:MAG: hypothetical protein IJV45_04360 [Prevotella sp.]|nr:hypothetical protein [Prevotella sp.]